MPNNVLTEDAIRLMRSSLTQCSDINSKCIDDVIFSITSACFHAFSMEEVGDPKAMRCEISKLLRSTENLLKRINELSLYSNLELEDGYSEEMREADSDIEAFKGSGITGEGMWGLKIRLRAAKKLAEQALVRVDVARGAPVNIHARALALEIRNVLDDHQVRTTSYDDAIYMQVLQIAFADLLPTEKAESYRRHGKWALGIHDPDNEIDWNTMRVDLSE